MYGTTIPSLHDLGGGVLEDYKKGQDKLSNVLTFLDAAV